MDAEDDGTDRFRVGRWVSDEDGGPGPLAAGENTLGRRFAWPEEIPGPGPVTGAPPQAPDEEEPLDRESPWIRMPAPVPDEEFQGTRLDEFGPDRGYRGHRRADGKRPLRWPILGTALVVVSVALAVLIVLAAAPSRRRAAGPPAGAGSPSAAATGQPSPTISTAPSSTAGPTQTVTYPGNVPPKPASATPFESVTIEAEAPGNILTGTATLQDYAGASGGKVVRNIGNWDGTVPGTLTFPKVTVPANGVYVLTFSYVHLDNYPQRTMVITIGGVGSFAVTVTGSSTCCSTKAVAVPLRKGVNRITFGNPDGHAPSLDKVVVSLL
jgi:hypothetical protein